MASDLEASLIDGGIEASAAKILSNAIENAATGRLSTSRQLEDATPQNKMRLIDSDTRRYLLTNLDHPKDNPFRQKVNSPGDPYHPSPDSHPYDGSQPASSNPTLATPVVKPGQYIDSANNTTDQVAQSEVSLHVEEQGGSHARLNKSTGAVENVPFLLDIQPKGLIEGEVVEEEGRTVIRLRVVNQSLRNFI
tara:strand:+ start:655 stop:1233 length:579 start_codon:yes stop_codon:yes gene_type:complete